MYWTDINKRWEKFTPEKFKNAVKYIIDSCEDFTRDYDSMVVVRQLCQRAQSQIKDRRVNIL